MGLKSLNCTQCGAPLKVDELKEVFTCEVCGASLIYENALDFSLKNEIDKIQIKILRENLQKAVVYNDFSSILAQATKILDLIPRDYIANYFLAFAKMKKGSPQLIIDFYFNNLPYTYDAQDTVLNHIINYSDLRHKEYVLEYLNKFSPETISKFNQIYEKRIRKENDYENVPRDVFICHSSNDDIATKQVLFELEKDSNKCWVSYRNLRPDDNENYWENIEKAIINCKIFLVISSRNSMISPDVKKELEIADKYNKIRLEVKIDDTPHTTLFKHFFDGIKWIDGISGIQHIKTELITRVYDLLKSEEEFNIKISKPTISNSAKSEDIISLLANSNFEKVTKKVTKLIIEDIDNIYYWWLIFLAEFEIRSEEEVATTLNDMEALNFINTYTKSQSIKKIRVLLNDNPDYVTIYKNIIRILDEKILDHSHFLSPNNSNEIVIKKALKDLNNTKLEDNYLLKVLNLLVSYEIYSFLDLDYLIDNDVYSNKLKNIFNNQIFNQIINDEFYENKLFINLYNKYINKIETIENKENLDKYTTKYNFISKKIESLINKIDYNYLTNYKKIKLLSDIDYNFVELEKTINNKETIQAYIATNNYYELLKLRIFVSFGVTNLEDFIKYTDNISWPIYDIEENIILLEDYDKYKDEKEINQILEIISKYNEKRNIKIKNSIIFYEQKNSDKIYETILISNLFIAVLSAFSMRFFGIGIVSYLVISLISLIFIYSNIYPINKINKNINNTNKPLIITLLTIYIFNSIAYSITYILNIDIYELFILLFPVYNILYLLYIIFILIKYEVIMENKHKWLILIFIILSIISILI